MATTSNQETGMNEAIWLWHKRKQDFVPSQSIALQLMSKLSNALSDGIQLIPGLSNICIQHPSAQLQPPEPSHTSDGAALRTVALSSL